jgi:hypothetical protein
MHADMTTQDDRSIAARPRRKASIGQVAATLFWGLFMIGKKGTWERDGAVVTLPQLVVGGLLGALLVVGTLILIVSLVLP